ncbi:unnamed protein product [Psylliodes chrysocephalus]|uniref:Axonemal 84 kDa protein n=1 Tax=Psylliodes chrysocephalus TaxID=3402493 RepID=A0A9P0CLW9_9CUCU|nr:unnamed protein product [Psylliodes chrysocephala]
MTESQTGNMGTEKMDEAPEEDKKKVTHAPKKSESMYISAHKSKSGSYKSVTKVGSRSKVDLKNAPKSGHDIKTTTSSKQFKKRKRAAEFSTSEEKILEIPSSIEVINSSSEESSSEEEKEIVRKSKPKMKKGKIGAQSEEALAKRGKKESAAVKGVKLKLEGDEVVKEGEMTEDELVAEFIKSKAGHYKPPPPLPDPAVLLEEAMIKLVKKPNMKKEEIEEIRIQQEAEIARKIEQEVQKRADELERVMENERREQIDAQLRADQLEKSVIMTQEVVHHFRETLRTEKELREWELYLQCRKLPNPAFCNDMTTFLRMWEENMTVITIPEASETTKQCLELISDLEEVIALATEDDQHKLPNWFWIRQLFRDQQTVCLDIATYRLMKNVGKNMNRVNIPIADYNFKDDYSTICVWLRVQNPIPLTNPRRPPRPRIIITFEKIHNFKLMLPYVLDCHEKAVRVMYLRYDHQSDTCENSKPPTFPPSFDLDMLQTFKNEWRTKLKYKYERRDRQQPPSKDDPEYENWVPEQEEFGPDEEYPFVPYKHLIPSPNEYVAILEEFRYNQEKKAFLDLVPVETEALNLRKFSILGGIFAVHYICQPPQPSTFATMTHIYEARLFIPQELTYVKFFAEYDPPIEYLFVDPNARKQPTPEYVEEYQMQQDALNTLIMIGLKIPQGVIFLRQPEVYVWLEDEKYWTNKYIHYSHFDQESQRIEFRSQKFGLFALATPRYGHLPYKCWEIKPEIDGSVTISIVASVLILEFIVKDGLICLSLIENCPRRNALQDKLFEYKQFHMLKKMLKNHGVDIFPEADSYFYVEGGLEKHWPTEKHLYTNMAALCGSFNFAWSKWNAAQSRKSFVVQMREYAPKKRKQKSFTLMMASSLKAVYLKCAEDTEEFSPEPMEGIKFSADLYNLMKSTVSMFLRNTIEDYSKMNIHVLTDFLVSTRLMSFC